MTNLFPEQIGTERLVLEKLCSGNVTPYRYTTTRVRYRKAVDW